MEVDRRLSPYLELTHQQRGAVAGHLRRERMRCPACDAADLAIGEALYLGFLFQNEDLDAYMVALTCTAPDCGALTGIRLAGAEFLDRV